MDTNSQTNSRRLDSGRTVLWASAFVIAALVIVQAGRLPGNAAYAGETSNRDGYTLVTADMGRGDDFDPDEVIYVIDNENGMIMIYEPDVRNNTLVLRDGGSLPALFRANLNR